MFIIWLINTEFGHLPKKKKKKEFGPIYKTLMYGVKSIVIN